jgi:hypothetical protein
LNLREDKVYVQRLLRLPGSDFDEMFRIVEIYPLVLAVLSRHD